MKATIEIDDELFSTAQEYAGVREKSAVINEALKAYVEIESGRRLARMGESRRMRKRLLAVASEND